MSLNETIPHAIEAEEGIIAAMLIDYNATIEAVSRLTPEAFLKEAHKAIFSAILSLVDKNSPVDLVTATNEMREAGTLEKSGGAGSLSRIIDSCPAAQNVGYYSRLIIEKAKLRELAKTGSELSKLSLEESDPAHVLKWLQQRISKIESLIDKDDAQLERDLTDDILEDIKSREGKSGVIGIPSGFGGIDRLIGGFQGGKLITLAARPAMGKSSLAKRFHINAGMREVQSLYVSLEMMKNELVERDLAMLARVNANRIRSGNLNSDEWRRLRQAAKAIGELPVWVKYFNTGDYLEVIRLIRRMYHLKAIQFVTIDYLQLLEGDTRQPKTYEISAITRALKNLAGELNIPILLLSQLNRKLEERRDKRPINADLKDSGSIEQDSDIVAFIYRPEYYMTKDDREKMRNLNEENYQNYLKKAEFIISKHRGGPTGTVNMLFHKELTLFEQAN